MKILGLHVFIVNCLVLKMCFYSYIFMHIYNTHMHDSNDVIVIQIVKYVVHCSYSVLTPIQFYLKPFIVQRVSVREAENCIVSLILSCQ